MNIARNVAQREGKRKPQSHAAKSIHLADYELRRPFVSERADPIANVDGGEARVIRWEGLVKKQRSKTFWELCRIADVAPGSSLVLERVSVRSCSSKFVSS